MGMRASSVLDFEIGDAQHVGLPAGPSTKDRSDSRQQFRKRERLHEVVVRAKLQTFHSILHAIASRQKQYGRGAAGGPQSREYGPPISLGQHDVEDDQVVLAASRRMQSVIPSMADVGNEAVDVGSVISSV